MRTLGRRQLKYRKQLQQIRRHGAVNCQWMACASATKAAEFFTSTSGAVTIDTATVRGGNAASFKLNSGAAPTDAIMFKSGVIGDAGYRGSAWYYFPSFSYAANNEVTIMHSDDGATNTLLTVALHLFSGGSPNFSFFAPSSTGSSTFSYGPLSTNTWYRVSWAYYWQANTAWAIYYYVNGSLAGTFTNSLGQLLPGPHSYFYPFELYGTPSSWTNFVMYCDEAYVDNGIDYADPGGGNPLGVTAKQAASVATSGFSVVGSGTATSVVSERPINTANYMQHNAVADVTETYNLQTAAQGDNNISSATILAHTAWVSAASSVAGTGTPKMIDSGTETALTLSTSPVIYPIIVTSATYPTTIGMRSANAAAPISKNLGAVNASASGQTVINCPSGSGTFNVNTGDTIMMLCSAYPTTTTITLAQASGTAVISSISTPVICNNGNSHMYAAYATVTAGGSFQLKATLSAAGAPCIVIWVAYKNVNSVAQNVQGTGNTGTTESLSLTTTVAGSSAVILTNCLATVGLTAGANTTADQSRQQSGTASYSAFMGSATTAAGAAGSTLTLNVGQPNNAVWAAVIFELTSTPVATNLYECGMMVAYAVPPAPPTSSGTATFRFTNTGVSKADKVASGTASFKFTTSGSGRADFTGHATATFTLTATGKGRADDTGHGAATFQFTVTAIGRADIIGNGAATLRFNVSAVGRADMVAHGTASFQLQATGSGKADKVAHGTAAFSFSVHATARADATGHGTGTFRMTAAGVGISGISGSGSGNAHMTMAAHATSQAISISHGNATVTFNAPGVGRADVQAHGTGSFSFTAAGHAGEDGVAHGAASFSITASAHARMDFTGHGASAFRFNVAGHSQIAASHGTAAFSIAASGVGRADFTGSGAAAFTITAAGQSAYLPPGTGSGFAAFSMTATGRTLSRGKATFSFQTIGYAILPSEQAPWYTPARPDNIALPPDLRPDQTGKIIEPVNAGPDRRPDPAVPAVPRRPDQFQRM
jgi:hypothetical protein